MRASESDRAVICPASLVLPRTRVRSQKTIEAADWGTLCHHWKETGETDPPWARESDIQLLERKLLATGVRREDWWDEYGGEHEVTFAVYSSERVAKYVGPRENADIWKTQQTDALLTGTIDWLGTNGIHPCIDDLKTGRHVNPLSKQLLSYALFDYLYRGRHSEYECGRSITHWPKYPIDGQPRRIWGPLITALDLEEHLDDLHWSLAHPDEINPTDDGCRWCDSRPNCPAWNLDAEENQ